MNTYVKYAPNVFVAKCADKHEKGEVVTLTTKYGKENDVIIHNLVGEKDGCYFYSFIRADGFNSQVYAQNKADKLNDYAQKAYDKRDYYFQASSENSEFLKLAEPIKVGHHSEQKHRALLARNWQRMGKSVQFQEKAQTYEQRAEYWNKRAEKVDLSMPESLEVFSSQLDIAKERHRFLKDNPEKREHSMALAYANKKVKDLQKKLDLALKLWG